MSSKCKQCGEKIVETGNYTFRILPAKRIPKKARKLMKLRESAEQQEHSQQHNLSAWGATTFHKFLLERSKPANFIEITCGKCGALSRIKMLKQSVKPKRTGAVTGEVESCINSANQYNNVLPASGRKKRKTKDKTAGLTITISPSSSGNDSMPNRSMTANPSGTSQRTVAQKRKEMENLKKVLFESKKAKKSGSTLKDFLSGI